MSLGFVHACEQNHLNLSVIGGGGVVQLPAGKVVTCPIDPLFIYNWAFGVRLAYDAAGAEAAFRSRSSRSPQASQVKVRSARVSLAFTQPQAEHVLEEG